MTDKQMPDEIWTDPHSKTWFRSEYWFGLDGAATRYIRADLSPPTEEAPKQDGLKVYKVEAAKTSGPCVVHAPAADVQAALDTFKNIRTAWAHQQSYKSTNAEFDLVERALTAQAKGE